MVDIISAPCRSCLHESEDSYDGCMGIVGFKCSFGYTPETLSMYGANTQESGQKKCDDYLHNEDAW